MRLKPEIRDSFIPRHLGPTESDMVMMLEELGYSTLEALVDKALPDAIKMKTALQLGKPSCESELLSIIKKIAAKNVICQSYIGLGYYNTFTPAVILRNILENPGWYTQYTPYQAEISQGRLEALFNFQTMVSDLTGLEIVNASLLDEATAAAEAMTTMLRISDDSRRKVFFVSELCHPQTVAVLKTRAFPLGIDLVIGDHRTFNFTNESFGALIQYPASDGAIYNYREFCNRVHAAGAFISVATDLLSLVLLTPPGEFGADIAVGNAQHFGVPLGYGGPHAAFFATHDRFKRKIPGRIIGLSVDRHGNPAYRMALQTREQHIRRERATSNICTSQVLLAIMAGMYAVYHGPQGLKKIATRVHNLTKLLSNRLQEIGYRLVHETFFDTIRIQPVNITQKDLQKRALNRKINLRYFTDGSVGIALDETTTPDAVSNLLKVFNQEGEQSALFDEIDTRNQIGIPEALRRKSQFLTHRVFNVYHSETEMLRYIHRLEAKDLALNTSMIPLGSCTMKLNGTTEMLPITWPEFSELHPFVPLEQARGYSQIIFELEDMLEAITGFQAVSTQPNSGAQGEYTGLSVIRAYQQKINQAHRNICLIPSSAHGTNPASSIMTGLEVVVVNCDDFGNIDFTDLKSKAQKHRDKLAALMITYPSTHGVFEEAVTTICDIVHANGGQVYMDGANLNALVGLSLPADIGADVIHINLHKTFAIPHGGGGPGMGPICVAPHLIEFLPAHPLVAVGGKNGISSVSAAPWGSPGILPISWAYITLMGNDGLKKASQIAILNANYMAHRLQDYYPILYRGVNGLVAHEFIIDLRPFRKSSGITDEDVAKRLMDYGFHAPTMSFPVPGTLMIEPTESESKSELDRYCDALISIKNEILAVETGKADKADNVLKNAPHTALEIASDDWNHSYTREQAAFPAGWIKEHKFWPSVGRINNAYGDRNLICTCPPADDYTE